MRFMSKSVVAGVATMSVLALGASSASATITPSTGTVTATNDGNVVLAGGITNTCSTVDFHGDINMNNPTTQGGGGIITGWTADGCSPFQPTAHFTTPWTLNINTETGPGTWTGTITNVRVTLSVCTFTGTLPLEYSNATGKMTITGGTLSGSPTFPCGATASVTGAWTLKTETGAIPQAS